MVSISTLQAMAGRFLATSDLWAWESTSQRRCTDVVRAFQQKQLDVEGLHAALTHERLPATAPPASSSALALIPLTGVLTPHASLFSFLGCGASVSQFVHTLQAAAADPKVKVIAVVVDSPGGSIRLVPEAAAAMRQARQRKPVVVSVAGMAASAAYWIASNATVIESTPSGSVGAIGILAERVSCTKQLEQDGIDVRVVSAGKFKSEGHPALPISAAEQQALQARVDAAYATFVADVGLGRHVAAADVRSGYAQGRLVESSEAARLGMIDRVATVPETLARALASSPTVLTAQLTHRLEQLRASTARGRLEQARAEIAAHRARLQASRSAT